MDASDHRTALFVHLLRGSFVRSYVRSFVHTFVRSFIRSFAAGRTAVRTAGKQAHPTPIVNINHRHNSSPDNKKYPAHDNHIPRTAEAPVRNYTPNKSTTRPLPALPPLGTQSEIDDRRTNTPPDPPSASPLCSHFANEIALSKTTPTATNSSYVSINHVTQLKSQWADKKEQRTGPAGHQYA